MDTATTKTALRKINAMTGRKHMVGVYAADMLPRTVRLPAAFIMHTENSDKVNGHWVACYIPKKGPILYFDSFGLRPHVENHVDFLTRFARRINYNKNTYQSVDSIVCGGYCLVFLARKMGLIKKKIGLMTGKPKQNDERIIDVTTALLQILKDN